MDPEEFSAAGIKARLQRARDAKRSAEEAHRAAHATEMTAMREAFDAQQVPPDAMARVIAVVERSIENGEREALVFQFPSDFMQDSGRSITSQYGDWTLQLTESADGPAVVGPDGGEDLEDPTFLVDPDDVTIDAPESGTATPGSDTQ